MEESSERDNDERELGIVEQKVLEAYKNRGSSAAFSKHPLQKLEQFFHECGIEALERRCKMVATHNLHLPTLAWVPDSNIRLHTAALHILAEITKFSCKDYCGDDPRPWADEVCKSITSLGGVRPILDKLDPNGEEVAVRYAATILTNLAVYSEQTSRVITKDPAVSNAVTVIRNHRQEDDDDLPIACAQLLVALSSNEENCVDLCFTRTLLHDLVACMSIQVSEVQKNIYETLANLSLNSYMKGKMAEARESGDPTVVHLVVRELNKGNALRDDMLVPLVRLIANVTVDVNSHEDLVARRPVQQDSDGKGQSEAWKTFLENIVRLLSNTQSPPLQLQLVRLLRNLAATQNCRKRIVQYGAAAPLFQVIRDTDIQDKQIHYWAAAAIASIARQPQLHPRLMQEKGLRPLVAFAGLQNSGKDGCDLRTRLYAAKTLAELAKNDDNKSAIIQEGGLVPLIVWARGFGNIEVQQSACEALSRLGVDASLLESKEDQKESNSTESDEQANIGIPEMVQLAESNFIEVQLFAAGELANLALNHESISEIIHRQGLPPLLKLAESPNETVQAQATRALLNLSSDDDGLDIRKYKRLLEERNEELKSSSKGVSRRIKDEKVSEYEAKIKLKEGKIVTYCERLAELHRLVHTSSQYVQRNVAATIANLAIYPEVQASMLLLETNGEGGIFNLIQMLHSSPSLDMKMHAARALFNLSVSDSCREKIVELRGVKICFDLLSHKNVQIKRLVVGIIAHIASSAAMRIELAGKSIDGLERLIALASETHVSIVQEQLARALAMLALNDENKRKIVDLGGSKIVIRWAGSTRIGVQRAAAKALCNLLEDKHGSNDPIRNAIFSEGALQVLFMLAQVGDSQTKLQVIRIMRSLRTYRDGAKWGLIFNFFKEGGITPLCHLVSNPPGDDLRLRVKADAAQELIKLTQSVGKDMSELLEKVLPYIAPLIMLYHKGEDLQQSTPEMRRNALGLFDKLIKMENYKPMICKMLSEDEIADELIRLKTKVNEARAAARKSSKFGQKNSTDAMKQVSDFDPLDEEVSKYVLNLVEALRISRIKPQKFNTGRDRSEEEDDDADTDKHLDDATRERLAQGAMAAENQQNVESAYVQMQTQLQAIEAQQLLSSGGNNLKKVFKVVVVGDAGVGKSSIIYRYTQQKAPPPVPKATLGCEYTSKRVERPGVTVLLQLFDIQGLENFRKAAPRAFFANAHGCIVTFDSASKAASSFYGAQEWKKTVDMHFEQGHRKGAPAILIANKADLPNNEKNPFVRSAAKMERCIAEHGFISWHNTSAKDGKGLKTAGGAATAFDSLIDHLLLWEKQGKFVEAIEEDTVDLMSAEPTKGQAESSGCSC